MQLSTITLAGALLAATAKAADASEAAFLTAFVSDFNENKKSYIGFLATAKDVPSVVTKLAQEISTYTDDSYTTLLDQSGLDINSLQDYATNLPWYSRIQAAAGGSAGGSTGGSDMTDGPSTEAASSEASSKASSSAKSASSTKASSSSSGGAAPFYAPAGVVFGAIAVALM